MLTRLAVFLLMVLASGTAYAELAPGWYASGCGKLRPHASEKAAKRQCKRPGDVVKVAAEPSMWVAGYYAGKTKKVAIAHCEREERQYLARFPKSQDWKCGSEMHAVYGPFTRKHADAFDRDFRYLTDEGHWVDENGYPPCFVADTLVATPDGPKAIESFVPGDQVISWDPNDRRMVTARVVRVKSRPTDVVLTLRLAGGRALQVTPNHPLWSPARDAWTNAGDLRAGDTVSVRAGDTLTTVVVESSTSMPQAGSVEVWDLTIDPTHTFFAEDVYVHNSMGSLSHAGEPPASQGRASSTQADGGLWPACERPSICNY